MNCSYEQWTKLACSNPSLCENTYGFIQCVSWYKVILFSIVCGFFIWMIFMIYFASKQTKLKDEINWKIKTRLQFKPAPNSRSFKKLCELLSFRRWT